MDKKLKSSEEGVVQYGDAGWFNVNFDYKDHVITLTLESEYRATNVQAMKGCTNIKILFDDEDVTDRYIETLNDEEPKIRTTLKNIAIIMDLIDQNTEEYEFLTKKEVTK